MYALLGLCVVLWWIIAILHENHAELNMCDHVVWYIPVAIMASILQLGWNLYKRYRTHEREHILIYGSTMHRCNKSVETILISVSTLLYIIHHSLFWIFVSIMVPWSPIHCDRATHAHRATLSFLMGCGFFGTQFLEKWTRRKASRVLATTHVIGEDNRTLP